MKRKVITIDGLAGSGKTSIASLLAKRIGFVHLNSGLLYRAYGYLGCQLKIDPEDVNKVRELLSNNRVDLGLTENSEPTVFLNGQMLLANLQQPEVSRMTSVLAALPEVREALIAAQRNAFPGHSIVAEGRDMGTVIFPDAELKFFIEASVAVRVERRIQQFAAKEPGLVAERLNILKKQMEIEIVERDQRDAGRPLAPAKPAKDALIVINEGQSLTAVVENMYALVANAHLI